MKTYVCKKCGKDFESKEVLKDNKKMSFRLTRHECPKCKLLIEPRLSGASLIVTGMFIIIFSGFILDDIVWRFGSIIGGACIALGIMRIMIQVYKLKKSKLNKVVSPNSDSAVAKPE